jgi:formylmethanofuran dehydrogenase subunit C
VSGWRLRLKQPPALRVDLRGVTPAALAALTAAQAGHWRIGYGNTTLPLAELFVIDRTSQEGLVFEGDLSRFDGIGWQMSGGVLTVAGHAGDFAGGGMRGGTLRIAGHAGVLAACEMAGGTLLIEGNVGDFAASTLPGSIDGMRGGRLIVQGNAGHRFADRMRRGTALVFGNAGDFLASRLVAGSIAIGGTVGAHVGYGMRRGSLVLAAGAAAAEPGPIFIPAGADAPVFWHLLARDLAQHGGPFASLPRRAIERHLGDRGNGGTGELILVR